MIRTIEYPLTQLYPDWSPVCVPTPDFNGGDYIRNLAEMIEKYESPKRFGIIGTGSVKSFTVYFEDPGDAVWFSLNLR